ncbi:transmembrane protein 42 isoform X1 [Cuculus canorus]|uniref:transmembrane protein 42 isoform X1 n=1 Tax=Cuculus canorus TaxID=55661 RepID=UPI0023AA53AB|nr:transmembrane protein 42 isoform X1 [Cuculus canorus]
MAALPAVAAGLLGAVAAAAAKLALAACAVSHQLCWLGVCLQCGHVDSLCKSPATFLLLGCCLCDNNGLQLHLFGHPGQASLWGDVDASVVGWPCCDALWPHAAAHCCTPARTVSGGEEGDMMAAGRGAVPCWPSPIAVLPHAGGPGPQTTPNTPATDLLTPAHLLMCQLMKSCWLHLS